METEPEPTYPTSMGALCASRNIRILMPVASMRVATNSAASSSLCLFALTLGMRHRPNNSSMNLSKFSLTYREKASLLSPTRGSPRTISILTSPQPVSSVILETLPPVGAHFSQTPPTTVVAKPLLGPMATVCDVRFLPPSNREGGQIGYFKRLGTIRPSSRISSSSSQIEWFRRDPPQCGVPDGTFPPRPE